jgi:hypothetical protein
MTRLFEWLTRGRRQRFVESAAELDDLGWTALAAEVRRLRCITESRHDL